MEAEIMTRQEAIDYTARKVIEAAIANTDAVQKWRAAAAASPMPSQREWRRTLDEVDETRAGLIEAVNAYRNARCLARCQPALSKIPAMVEAMEAGR